MRGADRPGSYRTTRHEERMSEYLDAMDIELLTEEEVERIGKAGEGGSFRKYPDDLVDGPV
jgi:diketogulonate reductase-like aldo/keto reductase